MILAFCKCGIWASAQTLEGPTVLQPPDAGERSKMPRAWLAQGSQVCSVSWWETRHGAGLLGVCLLLPGTSARQGIPAIAPSKQSYWECQIRHRAWSRQRGTRGSPGESVFLVQGQLAPHCHPPAHPTPGLHPFESLCPSGVFTMAPLWAQSAPEWGGGWNRPTGLVQVTIWPSGTVWK